MSYILTPNEVRELKWKRSFPRETKARVVPYYIHEGMCYFLLGRENFNTKPARGIYNMLGGHRESNETILTCAERELHEESIGVLNFGLTHKTKILQRNRRYIFFIPFLGSNHMEVIEEFEKRKKLVKNHKYIELTEIMGYPVNEENIGYLNEIDELRWVPETGICGRHIYRSVVDVFQNIFNKQENIGLEGLMSCLRKAFTMDTTLPTDKPKFCGTPFDVLTQCNA